MYTSGHMPGRGGMGGPGRPPRPTSPEDEGYMEHAGGAAQQRQAPYGMPAGARPLLFAGGARQQLTPARAKTSSGPPPAIPKKPTSRREGGGPPPQPPPKPAHRDTASFVHAQQSTANSTVRQPAAKQTVSALPKPTTHQSYRPEPPKAVTRKVPFADTDLRNAVSAGKRGLAQPHLAENIRRKGEEELDTTFRATRAKGAVDDMVLLSNLKNEAIVENLSQRYFEDKIYTYIGPVLISVNPFKKMRDVGPDVIRSYIGRAAHDVPPHIYAVADKMYRWLVEDQYSQCVIISGESGAGKTEGAKLIMNHWVVCSGGSDEVDRLKDIILKSNPLLEAFGNAKTLRNDNSSRFGKLFEIQFDRSGRPVGGLITNFLLEKSRLVSQLKGERNFHIFYQVLAGASQEEKEYYGFYEPINYAYLAGSECFMVDQVDDNKEFQITRQAMEVVGIGFDEQQDILRLLAAILALGNISFREVESGGCTPADPAHIEFAATLLGVDVAYLEQKLTSRTVTTGNIGHRGSVYDVPFSTLQADAARDALTKSMYSHVFDHLIETVNVALGSKNTHLSLNVLDIYGFEIFEHNGFEQFCINYVNEKLQQIFIELTLQSEQDDYIAEGIEWMPIKFFNNKIVCDLIEGRRPPGILAVLDDVCKTMHQEGEGVDEKFLQKAQTNISNPHFTPLGTHFVVKHYAGNVEYECEGFIMKNKDILFKDIVQVMQSSDQPFVVKLFANEVVEDGSRKAPTTVGFKIYTQAQALVTKLKQCEPSYVRCIKPNETKRAHDWDDKRVLHQAKYLGLLENVRVRRAGFAYRGEYSRFIGRYNMCHVSTRHWNKNPKKGATQLMYALGIPESEWCLGKTKMFIKSPEILFGLDDLRDRTLNHYAGQIQRFYWRHDPVKRRIEEEKIYWWEYMVYIFSNVNQDPHWGKYVEWPEYQEHLRGAVSWTWTIFRNWRAYKMVASLTRAEQEAMRQKIVSYDIFNGKKAWPISREYVGNYLSKEQYYSGAAQYRNAEAALLAKRGEKVVIFSDIATKVNRVGKLQDRALMVTADNFYKYDFKKLKMIKKPMSLSSVTEVSMSPYEDTYVIVHMTPPERDLLINLNVDRNNKVAEFVTMLYQSYMVLHGQPLKVSFVTSATCNLSRSAKSEGTPIRITWEKDPKPTPGTSRFAFTKRPNGVIYYTP